MKERPILFNAAMVRAILSGAKTQTRRVMKVQPPSAEYKLSTCIDTTGNKKEKGRQHWITMQGQYSVDESSQPYFSCQFGYVGDQLWVRETCRAEELKYAGWEDGVRYPADGTWIPIQNAAESADAWVELNSYRGQKGAVVPSIHMPRWASRITLKITGVRVELLNDISEADSYAEGAAEWAAVNQPKAPNGELDKFNTCRLAYQALWESINGEGSWAANPYVWVIEFEVRK